LLGTDLRMALLDHADLRGADLNEDLREARLRGAALREVVYDRPTTHWPDRFNLTAQRAGATRPEKPAEMPPDVKPDTVANVVDGDTLVLHDLGPVRLLAIDAPQAEEPPAECYSKKATTYLGRLLPKDTRVYYTLGSARKDKFDRNLGYLWLESGVFVNEQIVEKGFARFHEQPHAKKQKHLPEDEKRYAERIKRAVIRADMAHRGLWTCPSTKD
jgi:endonuclease YncB( thermonuclease family)